MQTWVGRPGPNAKSALGDPDPDFRPKRRLYRLGASAAHPFVADDYRTIVCATTEMAVREALDSDFLYKCCVCDVFIRGGRSFRHHVRSRRHPMPIKCTVCDRGFYHLTSLTRHTVESHIENNLVDSTDDSDDNMEIGMGAADDEMDLGDGENLGEQDEENQHNRDVGAAGAGAMQGAALGQDALQEEENANQEGEAIDLVKTAASIVLTLRQCPGATSASIERCEEACFKMAEDVNSAVTGKVKQFLIDNNLMDNPASEQLLKDLKIEDPFSQMRTVKQQLKFFSKEYGLVIPETKFLDYRIEYFLNSESGIYEPQQVPMTFENGILRSYLDGSRYTESELLQQFPHMIRINLFWDDLEVVNPLGSKTSIHKLAAFYFAIQNLPAVENSQLSSVHLVALAHSEDIREAGFDKVLSPLISELKKLESERGVKIPGEEPDRLRATLCCLCCDGLAAHDLIGLLGPGARHFCRICMISRPEFHANLNSIGARRTKAMFEEQLEEVRQDPRKSKEYGVKRECPLDVLKTFSSTTDSILDIFHVLLEGATQWILVLTLRSFISRKLVTVDEINGRLHSFNYGVTDIKNKPSSNLSLKTLMSYTKLKQTGSQVWCFLRIFGFLVPNVPDDDLHLKLLNLHQEICLIVFAEAVRQTDIDRMEILITEHHALFQQLYLQDLNQEAEAEEDADDPDLDPQEIRQHGPLVKYWCARFEARHNIFVKYGSVCGNFINPPKTMAQMHQISTLGSILKTTLRSEDIESQSTQDVLCQNCTHSNLLMRMGVEATSMVSITRTVKVSGDIYRDGLFVLLDSRIPAFGVIQKIYLHQNNVFLVVSPWETLGFVRRYCAYQVNPSQSQALIVKQADLSSHRTFAPWRPWKLRETYLAPRTIIFPM
ncbi:Zinc finger and SCAN domain-containing protein 32 [Frankliniella fusca]|uniref:Zinc finger and SCAN domain-containing protein 32 n=1 Tax=Frankliniella fusca TaxID=407009 RepID=A0AAE1GWI6_9NEOP|nr:Zinc finger and SCAN domain-containing protein 32 [Frankliniella fusca]